MQPRISIRGLIIADETLFDDFVLPQAMSKEYFLDMLLLECSELEILIPDPRLLKRLLKSWSNVRLHSWEKLYETTVQEYNMIHNYNRDETITSTPHGKYTDKSTYEPHTGQEKSTAAYNDNDLKTVERVMPAPDAQGAKDETIVEHDFTAASEADQYYTEVSNHTEGNIGVTTNQQMLEAERKLDTYDVYLAIVQEFKTRFCIVVY